MRSTAGLRFAAIISISIIGYVLVKTGMATGQAYFIAVNISAFVVFAYDKRIAGKGIARVPERFLLLLGVLGGTPALLLGMFLLRHKIRDSQFRNALIFIALLQIIILLFFV